MMHSLFQGYRPRFRRHRLGWEGESLLQLSPSQQMCYYDGKLFGGYIAFLMDRLLVECCKPVLPGRCEPDLEDDSQPAYTAYLHTSFLHSIPPTAPILLRAWPDKVEGRKIFLKGSVQIPGKTNEWVHAIDVDALFIRVRAQ